jgi:nitrite reductase/ring-hydroxylating ferredoxin subunit/uncharacterized membrane protein
MTESQQEANRPAPLAPLLEAVESAEAVDEPAKQVAKFVRDTIPGGAVKDAISGTWLGHPLHPLLTDVVIGSFVSATMLDWLGGDEDAAGRLIGIGMAAYGPTALAGASDWADAEPADDGVRRLGIVHALTNSAALTLYAASLARRRGGRGRGKLLSLAGAGVLSLGGYLGGHLSFAKGIGVDQTVFDPGDTDWEDVIATEDLADDQPQRLLAGDAPVMVVRTGGELRAIHDRCSHRGCSLADGDIEDGSVVCACHGSRFSLSDGSVLRGPAVAPQPAFEVREREGRIEVRAAAG